MCLLLIMLCFNLYINTAFADYKLPGYGDPIACGNINNIPPRIPQVMSGLISIVQVIVPVLMVIFGVIDLVKALSTQKEDEIKAQQKTLVKRIIVGSLIFLVVLLTKFFVNIAASGDENKRSIISCVDCFTNYNRAGCSGSSSGPGGSGGSGGNVTNHRVTDPSGFTFDVPTEKVCTLAEYDPRNKCGDYERYVVTYDWGGFIASHPDAEIMFYINSGFDGSKFTQSGYTLEKEETKVSNGKNFDIYYYISPNEYRWIGVYYQYSSSEYIYAEIVGKPGYRDDYRSRHINETISIMLSARK